MSSKGVTYEQAARDIKLSGDIRQIGESAARIAINDGLYMAEGVSRTKAKPSAKTVAKAESKNTSADKPQNTHKSAIRAVKGSVVVAPDVKVAEGMKGDIEVLNRIAEVGDVAVVIEKFEGSDKDAKGFYSKGVIHLNADKLSEGGFTYTGIHESVHYLAEVNPEGYAAIEKFLKNYYKQQGVDLESEIKLTKALYSERGVELTKEEAMEEIVCNTLSDIATDKKALSAFLNLSKKEQKSFVDFIRDIAKRLKAWADKNLKGSKYHSVIVKDAKTLRELAEMFNTELSKSAQKNNTAKDGGVRHSYLTDDVSIKTNIADGNKALDYLIKQAENHSNPETLIFKNAMYREDIGYIDFVWGRPGQGKKFKKGYGVSHIIAKRNSENGSGNQTIRKLVEVIAKSDVMRKQNDTTDSGNGRIKLFYDGYTAVLSQRPSDNHWLLTGWENEEKTVAYANGEVRDSTVATTTTPTLTRRSTVDATVSTNSLLNRDGDVNKKSYSFGEEDLDFGLYLNENSEVAENLKESGRAVGAIFEKTKGAEVDIFDVSKVMKKNLRDFDIKRAVDFDIKTKRRAYKARQHYNNIIFLLVLSTNTDTNDIKST